VSALATTASVISTPMTSFHCARKDCTAWTAASRVSQFIRAAFARAADTSARLINPVPVTLAWAMSASTLTEAASAI